VRPCRLPALLLGLLLRPALPPAPLRPAVAGWVCPASLFRPSAALGPLLAAGFCFLASCSRPRFLAPRSRRALSWLPCPPRRPPCAGGVGLRSCPAPFLACRRRWRSRWSARSLSAAVRASLCVPLLALPPSLTRKCCFVLPACGRCWRPRPVRLLGVPALLPAPPRSSAPPRFRPPSPPAAPGGPRWPAAPLLPAAAPVPAPSPRRFAACAWPLARRARRPWPCRLGARPGAGPPAALAVFAGAVLARRWLSALVPGGPPAWGPAAGPPPLRPWSAASPAAPARPALVQPAAARVLSRRRSRPYPAPASARPLAWRSASRRRRPLSPRPALPTALPPLLLPVPAPAGPMPLALAFGPPAPPRLLAGGFALVRPRWAAGALGSRCSSGRLWRCPGRLGPCRTPPPRRCLTVFRPCAPSLRSALLLAPPSPLRPRLPPSVLHLPYLSPPSPPSPRSAFPSCLPRPLPSRPAASTPPAPAPRPASAPGPARLPFCTHGPRGPGTDLPRLVPPLRRACAASLRCPGPGPPAALSSAGPRPPPRAVPPYSWEAWRPASCLASPCLAPAALRPSPRPVRPCCAWLSLRPGRSLARSFPWLRPRLPSPPRPPLCSRLLCVVAPAPPRGPPPLPALSSGPALPLWTGVRRPSRLDAPGDVGCPCSCQRSAQPFCDAPLFPVAAGTADLRRAPLPSGLPPAAWARSGSPPPLCAASAPLRFVSPARSLPRRLFARAASSSFPGLAAILVALPASPLLRRAAAVVAPSGRLGHSASRPLPLAPALAPPAGLWRPAAPGSPCHLPSPAAALAPPCGPPEGLARGAGGSPAGCHPLLRLPVSRRLPAPSRQPARPPLSPPHPAAAAPRALVACPYLLAVGWLAWRLLRPASGLCRLAVLPPSDSGHCPACGPPWFRPPLRAWHVSLGAPFASSPPTLWRCLRCCFAWRGLSSGWPPAFWPFANPFPLPLPSCPLAPPRLDYSLTGRLRRLAITRKLLLLNLASPGNKPEDWLMRSTQLGMDLTLPFLRVGIPIN